MRRLFRWSLEWLALRDRVRRWWLRTGVRFRLPARLSEPHSVRERMTRTTLCRAAVAIAALAAGPGFAQDDAQTILDRWISDWSSVRAVRTEWRTQQVIMDGPSASARPVFEYVVSDKLVLRWPDEARRVRRLVEPGDGAAGDPGSPLWQSAKLSTNDTEVWLPDGRSIWRSDAGNEYRPSTESPSIVELAPQFACDMPFVIALTLHNDPSLTRHLVAEPMESGWTFRSSKWRLEFDLTELTVDGTESRAIRRIAYLLPDGWTLREYRYGEFKRFAGAPGPMATQRTNTWTPPKTDAFKSQSDDSMLSFEILGGVPDSEFAIDLTGKYFVDRSSGEIQDAAGASVGQVKPRRRVGVLGQWATLIGAPAAGVIVLILGLLWLRRHAGRGVA